MPRAEKKNDMEDVQLTQEDIRILSDYSWDMTGYTSRFGYFYLSSDRENVKGLTKWQAEHIFQLTPTPPDMEDPACRLGPYKLPGICPNSNPLSCLRRW